MVEGKKKKQAKLREVLKAEMEIKEVSLRTISEETGIKQPVLYNFLSKNLTITDTHAYTLANYLCIELDEDYKHSIGIYVKRTRAAKGMNVVEFAEQTKINSSTLSQLEQKVDSFISDREIRIACALKISLEELAFGPRFRNHFTKIMDSAIEDAFAEDIELENPRVRLIFIQALFDEIFDLNQIIVKVEKEKNKEVIKIRK